MKKIILLVSLLIWATVSYADFYTIGRWGVREEMKHGEQLQYVFLRGPVYKRAINCILQGTPHKNGEQIAKFTTFNIDYTGGATGDYRMIDQFNDRITVELSDINYAWNSGSMRMIFTDISTISLPYWIKCSLSSKKD